MVAALQSEFLQFQQILRARHLQLTDWYSHRVQDWAQLQEFVFRIP